MVRKAREISPTGYYHVMLRGNNRETIFAKPKDRQYMIETVHEMCVDESIELVAYCTMNNHIHLLLKAGVEELSTAMKRMNVKYAMNYNAENKRIGHVFQDRFKSETIKDEAHLLCVLRYIHNNPVKAKIVASPSDYLWSSYGEYTGKDCIFLSEEEKEIIMACFSGKRKAFIDFHMIRAI